MPIALVTGVSRRIGIGHAVAERLEADGFTVVGAGWRAYDDRMPWGSDPMAPELGGRFHEVDFEDPVATAALVPTVHREHGPIDVLVMCHCESVDSDFATTTVESFDRHMAVNARATWQLIQSFAAQLVAGPEDPGDSNDRPRRIIAITSDHTAGNLAYGASKGAMDRIVLAAAIELADLGLTANVINPGATNTGWMTAEVIEQVQSTNLQPRIGQPADVANLVAFLCSDEGQWINAQLLHSDGGRRPR